jgi:hypothetical protein
VQVIARVKMPNLEEHCKHSKERYGFDGREIHQWLDEPSQLYCGSHRGFRHDEETIVLAGNRFGKNYGEGLIGRKIAEEIALDHFILDHQESLNKHSEKNEIPPAELVTYKQEKEKYEKKRVELKKTVDEYSKLPKSMPREMNDYLEVKFADTPNLKMLAEVALRHWYQYLRTRDNTNTEIEDKDVFRFITQLKKKVNATTRSNYLGQLVPYFKHAYGDSIAQTLQKEKLISDKEKIEIKKNFLPLRIRDVKLFYQKAKLPVKIAVRILLLEDIPVEKLSELYFVQYFGGEYHFQITLDEIKREVQINAETVNLAIPLLQKSKNGKLFRMERP